MPTLVLNTLYSPLLNQYNTNFSYTRISFPLTEISLEDLKAKISSKDGDNSNLFRWLGTDNCRFANESEPSKNWGNSNDIWSQERDEEVASIDEALDYYFKVQ